MFCAGLNFQKTLDFFLRDKGSVGQAVAGTVLENRFVYLKDFRVEEDLSACEVIILNPQTAGFLQVFSNLGKGHHGMAVVFRPATDKAMSAGKIAQGPADLHPQSFQTGHGNLRNFRGGLNRRRDVMGCCVHIMRLPKEFTVFKMTLLVLMD